MSAPPVILNPQQVVPLVSVSGHFNYESDVTALANGRSVITWADWFYNGTGYTQTIYARLLDAYGNQVGGIIAVSALSNSSSVPASHSPSVSALANGGFVIGFTRDYTNTDLDSYYRVYDATGGTVVGISAVAGGGDNEQTTDVVGLANGGWAGAYTNYTLGAGNVYARFYNSAGVSAGIVAVGVNDASLQSNAQLATLSNGNVVVAYNSTSGGDRNVLYRIVTSTGAVVVGDQIANSQTTGAGGAIVHQDVGSVAALSNGGFAVAYTSQYSNGGSLADNDYNVHIDIFTSSGVRQVSLSFLGSEMQYDPAIVGLPDGTFAVTYSDRLAEGGQEANQHTKIYTNSGSYVGEINPVNTTTAGSQLFPNSAVLSDGRVITTWTDVGGSGNVGYAVLDSRTRAGDFGGNGRADLFWRNSTTGENIVWWMNGNQIGSAAFTSQGAVLSSYWRATAGASDFDNNGRNDVLWRGNGGELIIWGMQDQTVTSANYITYNGSQVSLDNYWTVGGTGNFGGLPTSDIFWRGAGGELVLWDMNGTAINQASYVTNGGSAVSLDSYWSVGGVADFSGDSRADILWRGAGGELITWAMNGNAIASAAYVKLGATILSLDSSWSVGGVGDFGGDGHADILWRNATTGDNILWQMDGNQVVEADYIRLGGNAVNLSSYWSVGDVADYTGDGRVDMLLRGAGNELVIWGMNGNDIQTANYVTMGGNTIQLANSWQVV